LSYDEVMADLEGAALRIKDYCRLLRPASAKSSQVDAPASEMVASARDTGKSPTFRKGQPGEWKKYPAIFGVSV
jgi:hypothetical protein